LPDSRLTAAAMHELSEAALDTAPRPPLFFAMLAESRRPPHLRRRPGVINGNAAKRTHRVRHHLRACRWWTTLMGIGGALTTTHATLAAHARHATAGRVRQLTPSMIAIFLNCGRRAAFDDRVAGRAGEVRRQCASHPAHLDVDRAEVNKVQAGGHWSHVGLPRRGAADG